MLDEELLSLDELLLFDELLSFDDESLEPLLAVPLTVLMVRSTAEDVLPLRVIRT